MLLSMTKTMSFCSLWPSDSVAEPFFCWSHYERRLWFHPYTADIHFRKRKRTETSKLMIILWGSKDLKKLLLIISCYSHISVCLDIRVNPYNKINEISKRNQCYYCKKCISLRSKHKWFNDYINIITLLMVALFVCLVE